MSADADGNFNTVDLPQGVAAIRFYQSTSNSCTTLGSEIQQTRLLADGESQLYCAVVTLKADVATASNTPVYFKVASSTYVSSNNGSNPGFDTLMNAINISSLNLTQVFIQRYVWSPLWSYFIHPILLTPVWLATLIAGVACIVLSFKKQEE